jgi:uncharacterized protein (DUF983 family)
VILAEQTRRVSVIQVIWRGLRARCPNCGSPTLFSHWWKMHDRCAVCGLRFERDEGFFLGAMTVNYAFTGLLLIPVILAAILHYLSLAIATALAAVIAIFFPVVFYPAAKTLWLMTWYAVFTNDLPANQPENRERATPETRETD